MRAIDYKQTVGDLLAFSAHTGKQTRALERATRNTFHWYVLVLTLIAIIVFLLTNSMTVLALEIVGWLITLPLLFSFLKRRIKSMALRKYQITLEKGWKGTVGKQRISLQDDYVVNENDMVKFGWKYNAVETITETAEYVYIYLEPTRAFIIPKRSTSPELLAEFLQELRSKMDAAKKITATSEATSK